FLWLLRTEGVTKAFSHRSHLYFLCPSCTTWMCTFSVSFLLKVASHWSHLKVLSPAPGDNTHTQTHTHTHTHSHTHCVCFLIVCVCEYVLVHVFYACVCVCVCVCACVCQRA